MLRGHPVAVGPSSRRRRVPAAILALVTLGCSAAVPRAADPAKAPPPTSPTTGSSLDPSGPTAAIAYPPEWDTATERYPDQPPVVVEAPPTSAEVLDEIPTFVEPVELDSEVLFASGTSTITEGADEALAILAAAAVAHLAPGHVLYVDGYVDDRGSPAFNAQLGTARAQAVADRLLRHQPLLEGRIISRGHGEDDLLDPTCQGDCPSNRKVVVSVAR